MTAEPGPSCSDEEQEAVQETVEVTVPAVLAYRELVARAATQVCRRLDAQGRLNSDEFIQEAVSAVGEAFNNIVLRSYGEKAQGYVTLIFHVFEQTLDITLLDYGEGAEVKEGETYEPLADKNEASMSRFIMQAFMDEVEHHTGTPNRLHMRKFLPR